MPLNSLSEKSQNINIFALHVVNYLSSEDVLNWGEQTTKSGGEAEISCK